MTKNETRVLIVDDEPAILRFLRNTLAVQGYQVFQAETLAEAEEQVRRRKPDLVILDLGLPDGNGMDLIAQIRSRSQTPIIVLSSRSQEATKVAALDAGADDYISKPFGVEELMARIRTSLRRRFVAEGGFSTFRVKDLEVDLTKRIVKIKDRPIKLSPKEYDILAQLIIHAGKVLTHRHLITQIWGSENAVDVQNLRVYVRQLRQKLELEPERPQYVLTEAGVGYRLGTDN